MKAAVVLALALASCDGSGRAAVSDASVGVDAGTAAPDAGVPDAEPVGAWPCAPSRTAGHQTFACPADVTADVEASAACVAGGCGVILDVHRYTMSADQQDQHTRMRALAPPRGYVVVQPTAPGAPFASWGTGERDDVVWDLLQAAIDVFDVDPDRVHVTGFSQGGMMSFRMLCAHSDALASIAPVAGDGCFDGAHAPAVERPILYVHGHLDTIIPWATMGAPTRDALLAAWPFGAPTTIASGAGYSAQRWVTTGGTPFELFEHDFSTGDVVLAGHCLPGPGDDLTFRCDASEFDEATLVLDFFDDHPRE